jgi:hypothetical protein
MRTATALALVLILSACTERVDDRPPAAPATEPPPQTVVYACQDNRAAEASYSADGALALTLGDETWPMNAAEAVSGSRWVGEELEWWVTLENGQEVGTLRRLGAQRVGETVMARCIRPTSGGVLAPEPPDRSEPAAPDDENRCRAPALSLDVVSTEGAAGSRYTVLAFVNEGSGACTLQGYPGLALIGPNGQPRPNFRINEDPGPFYPDGRLLETVSLAPGGRAYFDLVSTAVAGDIPGETEPCAPIIAIRVSPPGDEGSVQAPLELNPCNGTVRVTAFRPVEAASRPE